MLSSLNHQFSQRVQELRLASGMTQEAFADRFAFARTYMSQIETGGANLAPATKSFKHFQKQDI
jgi:transcriptional regulator with XRE-family HTH domain